MQAKAHLQRPNLKMSTQKVLNRAGLCDSWNIVSHRVQKKNWGGKRKGKKTEIFLGEEKKKKFPL